MRPDNLKLIHKFRQQEILSASEIHKLAIYLHMQGGKISAIHNSQNHFQTGFLIKPNGAFTQDKHIQIHIDINHNSLSVPDIFKIEIQKNEQRQSISTTSVLGTAIKSIIKKLVNSNSICNSILHNLEANLNEGSLAFGTQLTDITANLLEIKTDSENKLKSSKIECHLETSSMFKIRTLIKIKKYQSNFDRPKAKYTINAILTTPENVLINSHQILLNESQSKSLINQVATYQEL